MAQNTTIKREMFYVFRFFIHRRFRRFSPPFYNTVMTFSETITEQMKTAMKSGDKLRLETLRSLRALILEFEKSGSARAMTDDDAQKILLSAAKKRKDAIEQYQQAGRTDLAQNEEAELRIIQEFLPAQMSDAEIEASVKTLIAQLGISDPKELGKLMGAAMKELRGKADGTQVQTIAKRLLGA